MKNFILGFLIAVSGSALAYQWNDNGSLTLTAEEVEKTQAMMIQMDQNFNLAVEHIKELQKAFDDLQKSKCV